VQLILASVTGFAAGALHVLSGPDHLAALAPIAVEGRKPGVVGGLLWGLGHGLGVILLVAGASLLGELTNLERLSSWSELLVGCLLVAVGAWAALRGIELARRRRAGTVLPAHAARGAHAHGHLHLAAAPNTTHPKMAIGFGLVHGAAGASHLFVALPALALAPPARVAYLAAYLLAAPLVMSVVGLAVGSLNRLTEGEAWRSRLAVGSGLLAAGVGAFWISAAVA
jgi:hypothetical protein